MKKNLTLLIFICCFCLFETSKAQTLTLKKGIINDSLPVSDSISETYSLVLPTYFDSSKEWPVVLLTDLQKNEKKYTFILRNIVEKYGYLLVVPNNLNDLLSLEENIQIAERTLTKIKTVFPVDLNRVYLSGFNESASFASSLAITNKTVNGVLCFDAPVERKGSPEIKRQIHFITVSSDHNQDYVKFFDARRTLNNQGVNNQLLIYDGQNTENALASIDLAFEIFTLTAMAKGLIPIDTEFVNTNYSKNIAKIEALINANEMVKANNHILAIVRAYEGLTDIQYLNNKGQIIKVTNSFQVEQMRRVNISYNERLLREDFFYSLYEDIDNHDYKNLGWWTYQIQLLNTIHVDDDELGLLSKKRLLSYIDFLVEASIEERNESKENLENKEGLLFLAMLKTIINPKDFEGYKTVITLASNKGDYETALFYVEELLKAGFKDKKALYEIENTALLRITPEFNALVQEYLNDARYTIVEQ